MEHNWDEELQFLINIRKDWCNSDYIEFLIDKVWRITKPINIYNSKMFLQSAFFKITRE